MLGSQGCPGDATLCRSSADRLHFTKSPGAAVRAAGLLALGQKTQEVLLSAVFPPTAFCSRRVLGCRRFFFKGSALCTVSRVRGDTCGALLGAEKSGGSLPRGEFHCCTWGLATRGPSPMAQRFSFPPKWRYCRDFNSGPSHDSIFLIYV